MLARTLHRLDGVAHKLQIAVVDLVVSLMDLLLGLSGLPFGLRTSHSLLFELQFEVFDALILINIALFLGFRLFFDDDSRFRLIFVLLDFNFEVFGGV